MVVILILALAGVIMISLEIILPGMILGIVGGIAIVASIVLCFTSEDLATLSFGMRSLIASGVFLGCVGLIGLWLKYFDRIPIGRGLVLSPNIDDHIETADQELVGSTGTAKTDLRPTGRVNLPGLPKSCDVFAEAGFIAKGSTIEVVKVDGRRVFVRPVAG